MTNPLNFPTDKVTISPIGMQVNAELTFEEWKAMAGSLGEAARSIGFIIGDWLVYGQSIFGSDGPPDQRVDPSTYQFAVDSTGMDRSTLHNYAYVSRCIPSSVRTELLSWEHHRMVAKLKPEDQEHWIGICIEEERAGRRISTRRLRKSISLGRVATHADMEPDPADKGIDNHIPFVNRLVGWWRRMQDDRFLDKATKEQREALKRDLEPVVSIYDQL